jgi:hypothetical protein
MGRLKPSSSWTEGDRQLYELGKFARQRMRRELKDDVDRDLRWTGYMYGWMTATVTLSKGKRQLADPEQEAYIRRKYDAAEKAGYLRAPLVIPRRSTGMLVPEHVAKKIEAEKAGKKPEIVVANG